MQTESHHKSTSTRTNLKSVPILVHRHKDTQSASGISFNYATVHITIPLSAAPQCPPYPIYPLNCTL